MPDWNSRLIAVVAALFLTGLSEASYATEQAQQRRAGRDVRQETRQGARHTKQDCRAWANTLRCYHRSPRPASSTGCGW